MQDNKFNLGGCLMALFFIGLVILGSYILYGTGAHHGR